MRFRILHNFFYVAELFQGITTLAKLVSLLFSLYPLL